MHQLRRSTEKSLHERQIIVQARWRDHAQYIICIIFTGSGVNMRVD